MAHFLANYECERKKFTTFLQADCQKPILIFRWASGIGKTTLLNACLQSIPAGVVYVAFDLKSDISVAEIFERVVDHLGAAYFPEYIAAMNSLHEPVHLQITDNKQAGTNNQINAYMIFDQLSPEARKERRILLTRAWFHDLRALSEQILLISIDTFNENAANIEIREWLAGLFLERTTRTAHLRVLLVGQDVPEANSEWGNHCEVCELQPVHEPVQWLSVVERLNRRINAPDPHSYLIGICECLKNRPDAIMHHIKTLPQQGVGA